MTPRVLHSAALAGAILIGIVSPAAGQLSGNLGALTPQNVQGYLAPLPEALSGTLNSGVFQGAKIPLAGFNVSVGIHGMGVVFHDEDRTYRPTDPPGFSSTGPVDVPTVVGSTQAVDQPGQGGTTMSYPGGFDLDQFVVAVPQLQIGSVLGTRAIVRYIALDLGDSELGHLKLFGVGAQHSLSRYLPALPVNLAAGVFYQTLQLGDDDLIDTHSLQFAVTASRAFGFAEPYFTLGYDSFHMEVNYQNASAGGEKTNVEFDSQNDAHVTGGVLLGMPAVKLFAELNIAAQTGVALGLRFGI